MKNMSLKNNSSPLILRKQNKLLIEINGFYQVTLEHNIIVSK